MQTLIALFTQLFAKAWAAIVIAFLTGGAATVFWYSPANGGSTRQTGTQPVVVARSGSGTCSWDGHGSLPVVPEANPGFVLIPVMAAMLLVSSRRFLAAKAADPSRDHEKISQPGI